MAEKKEQFLMYKGKPLVRNGNIIYYGNMSDKYVIMLQIENASKNKNIEISGKVIIQLMYTDPELRIKDRVVKKSEKNGLYEAMDLGTVWLERALAD